MLEQNARLVKVETKPLRGYDGRPLDTPQMYIKVFETEKLGSGEVLVEAGTESIRGPDGMPYLVVQLYNKVDIGDINVNELTAAPNKRLAHAAGLYDDIADVLRGKFKQYMDGVKALERNNSKSKKN